MKQRPEEAMNWLEKQWERNLLRHLIVCFHLKQTTLELITIHEYIDYA